MYKEEQDMFEGLRFNEINEVREVHYKSKREKEYEEKTHCFIGHAFIHGR